MSCITKERERERLPDNRLKKIVVSPMAPPPPIGPLAALARRASHQGSRKHGR